MRFFLEHSIKHVSSYEKISRQEQKKEETVKAPFLRREHITVNVKTEWWRREDRQEDNPT